MKPGEVISLDSNLFAPIFYSFEIEQASIMVL